MHVINSVVSVIIDLAKLIGQLLVIRRYDSRDFHRMDDSAQVTSSEAKVDTAVKKSPSDFLKQVLGKPVIVQLNSGVTYRGILACLDGFLNIAMEQTEEYVDGQLKNRYGDCFIRGNNGET
jgi:U6 snRNA-associated Sm-like protein LSm6